MDDPKVKVPPQGNVCTLMKTHPLRRCCPENQPPGLKFSAPGMHVLQGPVYWLQLRNVALIWGIFFHDNLSTFPQISDERILHTEARHPSFLRLRSLESALGVITPGFRPQRPFGRAWLPPCGHSVHCHPKQGPHHLCTALGHLLADRKAKTEERYQSLWQ